MTHITRIDGSPGAGKSHTLRDKLAEEQREHGVDLSDFRLITFTNAARDDVVDDVVPMFEGSRDDVKDSVRTLHSVAIGEALKNDMLTELDEQLISQESERGKADNIYQEFADRHGMAYYGKDLRDDRDKGGETGAADDLYRLETWLRLTQRDPSDAKRAPFTVRWGTKRAVELIGKWRDFKRHGYDMPRFEHTDYLDRVIEKGLTPDHISVLLLDEFQDFSPQEYRYYKLLRDSVDRVYLAGDPNQSIYSFRAGHPYYFRNTDSDDDIYLSESYRCRGEIATYARYVLNGSPEDKTDFSPVYDDGVVRTVNGSRDSDLQAAVDRALSYDDGAYILARTNSKIHSIKRWLANNGYPYGILGTRWRSLWNERLTDMLEALRTLQRGGGGVPRDGVNRLMAHTPKAELRKSQLDKHGDVYSVGSVWNAFTDIHSITGLVEALDLNSHKREALANAALRPNGNTPEQLGLGTIHAAKGLERPAVLLFNSYNAHIAQQYRRDKETRAEEHRIAYVGATRAEKDLSVVRGFFNGPDMKPLTDAMRAF